jgi:hypothetical protein
MPDYDLYQYDQADRISFLPDNIFAFNSPSKTAFFEKSDLNLLSPHFSINLCPVLKKGRLFEEQKTTFNLPL